MNKRIVSLALVLVLLLVFLSSGLALALGNTVGDDSSGPISPPQNLIVYNSGWYYAFYDHYWKSSNDGITWGGAFDLSTGNCSIDGTRGLDVASYGNEVAIATEGFFSGGGYLAGFRLGFLSDGNITWADCGWQSLPIESVYGGCYRRGFGVGLDGSGHYWVGYDVYLSYEYVTRLVVCGSSTTDGTWTNDSNKAATLASWSGGLPGTVKPVGLTSTCDVFYTAGGHYLYMRQWNIGTYVWGAEFRAVKGCVSVGDSSWPWETGYGEFSVTRAPDDTVQYVYEVNPGGDIDYGYFYAAGDRCSSETTLSSGASVGPAIGIGMYSDDLFVWWASGATLYLDEQFGYSGNWTGIQSLGNESLGFGSEPSAVFGGEDVGIGVMYHTSTSAIQYYKFYGNESVPVVTTYNSVETSWTWDGSEWSSTARLRAHLDYDGSADCLYRFGYKLSSAGSWSYTDWYDSINSPAEFDVWLYGLTPDSSYDMFGQAENSLYMGNGSVVTFTAAGVSSEPSVTPGPSTTPGPWPTVPPSISKYLNGTVKLIIAILVTVAGALLIAWNIPTKQKNAMGYAMMIWVAACVVGFSMFGWFPTYVLILIGGVIAVILFSTVMNRGGNR